MAFSFSIARWPPCHHTENHKDVILRNITRQARVNYVNYLPEQMPENYVNCEACVNICFMKFHQVFVKTNHLSISAN